MIVALFLALLVCICRASLVVNHDTLQTLVNEAEKDMSLRCRQPTDVLTPIFLDDYCFGTAVRNGEDLHVFIRGTDFSNFMDDFINVDIAPSKLQVRNTTLMVHSGFLRRAKQFKDILHPLIDQTKGDIYLFGHSQGGATVILLGLLLESRNPYMITIGSPQVVTGSSHEVFLDRSLRFEMSTDPVPLLPGIGGYHHIPGHTVRLQKPLRSRWLEKLYDFFRKKDDGIVTTMSFDVVYKDHFKDVYLTEIRRWLKLNE